MFTKDKFQNQNQDGNEVEAEEDPENSETTSESTSETTGSTAEPEGSEVGFENRPDYTKGPRRSPFFVLKMTVREFQNDGGTDLAAALTYYSVLSIFPGMIALLSLVGIFGQADESVDKIIEILKPLVSPERIDRITQILNDLASSQAFGVALVVGVLGALWSASGYVGAFSRAMNRIYEVEEGRPFWRMRPMQIVLTVITVVLCAVALAILIVSGPVAESVGKTIGVGDDLVTAWDYAEWPVLAVIVMVIVALLYHATPNVAFEKFRVISVGAFVAILIWLVASIGFAYYVANFSTYNKTYGSIAGVIVALLWLWITNLALLFGAELDSELERGRELQLGLAAEEKLQLPMRDTRNVEKATSRRAKDIEKMREIRLAAAAPGDPADRPFGRH